MKLEISETIDRPPEIVFQFVGPEQVQNHPRWDTTLELEQLTDGPVGVGTVIRRRRTIAGELQEGTMECVEFDPPKAMGFTFHDPGMEGAGRMVIEPNGRGGSTLTMNVDIPSMSIPLDPALVRQSARRIKELIESER
jgi:uncharacterized protein YndB with AHSA1/START domain